MNKLLVIAIVLQSFQSLSQNTSFFKEEFDDNKNHWFVGEIKKSAVQLQEGHYSVYNDEGKNPIVSLVDLPFNESKGYEISSNLTSGYIPSYSKTSVYGVMFAAKDEDNGYALMLDQYSEAYFMEVKNGKLYTFGEHVYVPEGVKGAAFKIILEDFRWKLLINDTIVYSGFPKPWLGHKVGFYSSSLSGYTAGNLSIEEIHPSSSACSPPFSQEKFMEQLGAILCSSLSAFSNVSGGDPQTVGADTVWLHPTLDLDGASDKNIVRVKDVKQFQAAFICADSMSEENSARLFDKIALAINSGEYSCVKLRLGDTKYNVTQTLHKDIIWFSNKSEYTHVELALHNSFKYYEVALHVYEK